MGFYVICDDDSKHEGMTKEQIIAAIAEATGKTPTCIDDAFITKIKEQNGQKPLKFWVGTQAEFNALPEEEENVFYIFTDSDEISLIQQIAREAAAGLVREFYGSTSLYVYVDGVITNAGEINWHSKKWSSGVAECCGSCSLTPIYDDSASNGISGFISTRIFARLPGIFSAIESVTADCSGSISFATDVGNDTTEVWCRIWRPHNNDFTDIHNITFRVQGTWN